MRSFVNEEFEREKFMECLQKKAADLGIAAGEAAAALAWEFFQEVLAASRGMSLTAITAAEEFARKHILDSWVCCRFLSSPGRLVDVGSGAGFPGIPIKILCQELEVVLLESSRKKCDFLRSATGRLGLKGIEVLNCRAEEAGRDERWRESFDFATCRAVGEFTAVAEYCLPLLRLGGRLLAQRGRRGDEEARAGQRAVEELGGRILFLFPYSLADSLADGESGRLGRAFVSVGEEHQEGDAGTSFWGEARRLPSRPCADAGRGTVVTASFDPRVAREEEEEKKGEEEIRWLVVIEKVHSTPSRYPRRSAAIAKRPLR